MNILQADHPDVYRWMRERGVTVEGLRLNRIERRFSSWYYGEIGPNGNPVLKLWLDMSDEEAVQAILGMVQSTVYDVDIRNDYQSWLLGKIEQGKKSASVYYEDMTKQFAGTTACGAKLVISYYSAVSNGVAAAELMIRVSEGDVSKWDLVALLPFVPKGVSKIKVFRNGKAIEYTRKELEELDKTRRAAAQCPAPVATGPRKIEAPGSGGRVPLPTTQPITTCFVAGTPILTPDGSRPIEEFREGDLIWSRAETDPTGPLMARAVEATFVRNSPVVRLRVSGRLIGTTAEHPVYVLGHGWRCVAELRPGDHVASHNIVAGVVEAVTDTRETAAVYNLRVADGHTYFVGEEAWGFSVWVHNAQYKVEAGGDGKFYVYQNGVNDRGNPIDIPVRPPGSNQSIPFNTREEAERWIARNTTGQIHHAISTKVHRALENHPNLKGAYARRDPRLVTRGANRQSHNGYQTWHRDLDDEVVAWIEANPNASVDDFDAWLRARYNQPDLAARFPNGLPK